LSQQDSVEFADTDDMSSARHAAYIRPSHLRFGILLLVLAALSFAPSAVKAALHTRGPMHSMAHVSLFAAMGVSLGRSRRWAALAALVLVAFSTEWLQAHCYFIALEWADIACDTLGAVAGCFLAERWASLRALAAGPAFAKGSLSSFTGGG
jgi:hypothetical protein